MPTLLCGYTNLCMYFGRHSRFTRALILEPGFSYDGDATPVHRRKWTVQMVGGLLAVIFIFVCLGLWLRHRRRTKGEPQSTVAPTPSSSDVGSLHFGPMRVVNADAHSITRAGGEGAQIEGRIVTNRRPSEDPPPAYETVASSR
jgi:hypothetical protein